MWERLKRWNARAEWWADRLVLIIGPPLLVWLFCTTPAKENPSLGAFLVTAGILGAASRVFSRGQYPTLAAVIDILFFVNSVTLVLGLHLRSG